MEKDYLTQIKRTDYCGNFTFKDEGKEVTVMGWVQRRRSLGGLIFVDLRDRTGILQLVFDESRDKELSEKAYALRSEDCIAVTGLIEKRKGATNTKIATGEIELFANRLHVFSKAETPPFEIVENSNVNEELRLKYRYLDLRRPDLQEKIKIRHKITTIVHKYFDEQGFLEIETPDLIRSSPEGARDYLVPSRIHPGTFYALPQSPQLYKQLLMVAGYDRYLQIARCFRDEDLRADRQPEFTQIDLEMSFVSQDDVISVNEGFLKLLFKETKGMDLKVPFDRLPYSEAMARYGSDKPDRRFGLELQDISETVKDFGFNVFSGAVKNGGSVRAIVAEGFADKLSRRDMDGLAEFVKTYRAKGLAWIKYTDTVSGSFLKMLSEEELSKLVARLNIKQGDVAFIIADKDDTVFASLGALRLELAKRFSLIKPNTYDFLWVVDFPLLEYSEEEERYVAKHHPFTMINEEDLPLIETAPEKVRAIAYDIVINGYEAGGGSLRIHSNEMQKKMFSLLGLSPEVAQEKFGYLLTAFKYGVPPHGGMAYGLDRLTMLISGTDNIRDVIAFPKVQNASELMTMCPATVDEKQLKELGISIDE